VLLPLGFWAAEADQVSASEERSSISIQSETALERRESPNPAPPNWERMDITSCKMPTTSCTVPTNSDGATLRNSNSAAALVGALAHSAGLDNNNVKMNVHVMRVGIGFVRDSTNSFVEERAIGRKVEKRKRVSRFHYVGLWIFKGEWKEME
jgi:hypothetical protein